MSDPTSTDSVTVNVGNADLTASAETPAPAKSKAPPAPPRAAFKFKRDATLSILVNPLIWVLFILDFVIWLVLFFVDWPGYFLTGKATMVTFFKFWFSGLRSHPASVGGGRVLRRDGQLMNYPFSERENTVHHCVQKAFEQYAHLKCMGTRTFVRMEKPEGSKFPLKVFGDTTWKSYVEVQKDAQRFGKGLLNLGIVEPMPLSMAKEMTESFAQIGGPHCMLIFEETCREWQTACLGCMGQSVTVATSYATLGMPAVAEALQQTRAPVILCNYKDVPKVAGLAGSCPDLKAIVYTRNCVAAEEPPLSGTMGELRVLSFDDVINSAPDVAESDAYSPPEPDHVGLIMYTSGSTGKPKGVVLKQSAIVAAMAGLEDALTRMAGARATSAADQETFLAYLPAAHILEFAAEMSCLVHGFALGYADPKTLSSKGAMRLLPDGTLNREPTGYGKCPPGAIQEFAPTVFAAVPKIWDIFKKGIEAGLGDKSPVIQYLFNACFYFRSMALQQGRDTPLFKKLLLKLHATLGGRLKLGITGGGPISADVQNWARTALCFNLVQGYALTETCSAGTVQPADSMLDGVAGAPVGCAALKVADCAEILDREEKPYLSTDTKHYGKPCLGRGEVWIKGACVSSGYYMQAEKTREEFDGNGWFHTGDIAIFLPNGQLKIVDRKKNLIKLKGGEYVAIESMEATYGESVYVNGLNGGIMCYADGDMDRPVALVQANDVELKKWAHVTGIVYESVEDLCENEEAIKMVTKDLNAIGKGKLGGNEALASVCLLPGTGDPTQGGPTAPWTPENNFLTASNKLNRKPIEKGFEAQLKVVKQKGIR